jgi:copper chaperone CopZ
MGTQSSKSPAGTTVLTVSGMTCGGCSNAVTRALSGVAGVTNARVDLASGCATVTGSAQAAELIRALEAAGFEAQVAQGQK